MRKLPSIKSILASTPGARALVMGSLRLTARDIKITNPWTSDRLLVNTFRHKGYWYFGKERESETMAFFAQHIKPGSTVIDVGGHIGFITQYFASLVGPTGRVVVFEPGSNNLPFIRANVGEKRNVTLEESAVSNSDGVAVFYEDNVTGQNNSLLSNYEGVEMVAKTHHVSLVKRARDVRLVMLDSYIREHQLKVDFIKIDVEGNDLNALLGAQNALASVPALMVEVTSDQKIISDLLLAHRFVLSDELGNKLPSIPANYRGNIFAVKA